ncbi:hypothetical protein DFH06DRAFT_1174242 [Mycena polygramma]|nr:hypothetical protein DFH06DRAFT_1174242 [Mycena polygramma]
MARLFCSTPLPAAIRHIIIPPTYLPYTSDTHMDSGTMPAVLMSSLNLDTEKLVMGRSPAALQQLVNALRSRGKVAILVIREKPNDEIISYSSVESAFLPYFEMVATKLFDHEQHPTKQTGIRRGPEHLPEPGTQAWGKAVRNTKVNLTPKGKTRYLYRNERGFFVCPLCKGAANRIGQQIRLHFDGCFTKWRARSKENPLLKQAVNGEASRPLNAPRSGSRPAQTKPSNLTRGEKENGFSPDRPPAAKVLPPVKKAEPPVKKSRPAVKNAQPPVKKARLRGPEEWGPVPRSPLKPPAKGPRNNDEV